MFTESRARTASIVILLIDILTHPIIIFSEQNQTHTDMSDS